MRKKFKRKKKVRTKKLIYFLLLIVLICIFRLYILRIKFINSNKKLINNLLENSNYYVYEGAKNNNILGDITEYINKNIFNSPTYILNSQLNYKSNNNNKNKKEEKKEEQVNKIDLMYENNSPQVYIYNSHQGEKYSTKYLEEHNIVPDVMMASKMLKEKLDNIGIKTLVEENDILAYMKKNDLDHSGSYKASRYFLEKAINKYSSVKLYIDLHRDAASHKATYTTINGKDCAKVLFVIGLEYDTYEENLKIATDINNIIVKKYPTLTRGIMKKEGYGVNGVYNQDLANNVILLEMGGNENNIDEINNTLDLIAEVIGEYINEKK